MAFVKIMALCHTVIPEHVDEQLKYRASSPGRYDQKSRYQVVFYSLTDEGALVKAACDLGIVFVSRTPSSLTIEVVSIYLWLLVRCNLSCALYTFLE